MKRYNPSDIEPKWQEIWAADDRYAAQDTSDKPKYYVSGMFPYPSGAGMHTGHFLEHSIVDAVARFRRSFGYNVLYPMGWDSFGLPAENYAIKTGKAPSVTTQENIASFKNQLKRVGASIDWSREINTADPAYYKWTQWVFTQLYERGLAYQKESLQWWCPVDKTVLANEQVEAGKCWRCGTEVEKKSMKQWFFKITDYADALLEEIPSLDWPDKIKTAQENWIGRSEGAEIEFAVANSGPGEAQDSLKFTPELTKMILDGKKTSTVRLEAKDLQVGDTAEFLTRDGETVAPFGFAKITRVRILPLGEIPNDLEGHEILRDDAHKLETYRRYYGEHVTLDTECTIYDFEFVHTPEEVASITVFSTRPDTLFGATFLVLAPEHPLARQLATDEMRESVENYIDEAVKKSEIERQSEGKEKTGVWTGSYAINPATGEKVPIWIADYVLGGYGTGAVMGVPAHDERDYEFAGKFKLPIINVINPDAIREDAVGKEVDVKKNKVVAVVMDETGRLLTINWGRLGGRLFIGGTVEGDEAVEQTALREVTEETGYTDLEVAYVADELYHYTYYARSKQETHETNVRFVLLKLKSDKRIAQNLDESEKDNFVVEWISGDAAGVEVVEPLHRHGYDRLIRKMCYHGEGLLTNSGAFDGMETSQAREEIVAWLEQQGTGRSKVTYKMRDWLISRQRYWGAPIPIIHCEEHGAVAVPEDQLPVLLPEIEDYVPKGDGKSPLAREEDWVNTTCPTCGRAARRETDVMDGYACSSWYLLRFTDPQDTEQAWAPEKASYWTPIDMYIGGDHAVAHLLYVRFWNHVFHDMALVPTKEPVKKLVYHGLVQAEDGRKMSKSLGNVVDPLEVIDQGYGADALRTFELFMGPINENSNWSSRGIAGVYRFLNRAWTLTQEFIDTEDLLNAEDPALVALQHRTIKKVTTDVHRLGFNTAIASLMEYVNELYKLKTDGFTTAWRQPIETLVQLLSIFAPHMSAELWQQLGRGDVLDAVEWPVWDEALTLSQTMTIVVQVNGKVRAKLEVAADASEDDIKAQALNDAKVTAHLSGEPKKVIYVKGKLLSIVA